MNIIRYRDWEFLVDYEATKHYYDGIKYGWSEDCACDEYNFFSENRHLVFPPEIINLLASLGVDFTKEAEVVYWGELESSELFYTGWYYFKGEILKGPDTKVNLGGGGFKIETIEITDKFRLGFTRAESINIFEKGAKAVHIEFAAFINSSFIQ